MNVKKHIYTLALAAGVFFCSGCMVSGRKNESFIFPFFNKIYSCNTAEKKLDVKSSTKYFFSRNFYIDGNTGWFSGSMAGSHNRNVLVEYNIKKNQLKEILDGQYLKIIPLPGYVITVSAEFIKDKGFIYEFYSLEKSRAKMYKLYSVYTDLFISDVENVSGIMIIAGYDRSGENNLLVRIDPLHQTINMLARQKRDSGFLKLIPAGKELIFYVSSQNWQENTEIFFQQLPYSRLLQADDSSGKEPARSRVVIPAGKFVLYGKGFYRENKLYLPVLDKEHNTGLLEIHLLDPAFPFTLYPLLTGIYAPVSGNPVSEPGNPGFIGYNYYKDKDLFHFVILPFEISPDNWGDVLYLPIAPANK